MEKIVALDAGHGGSDFGAIGRNSREKDLNLRLGAELFAQLLQLKLKPVLVRAGDYQLSLSERVNVASSKGADVFLSLHHNGFSDPAARGCETFYYPGSSQGKKLARELQAQMLKFLPTPDRKIKASKNLYVLRATSMPAVLIEPLFITSPRDEKIYSEPDYFSELAARLAQGLHRYYCC